MTLFNVNRSELLSILTEDEFPEIRSKVWMDQHFFFFLQMTVAYVITIFGIRHFMRNREPFDLQLPLNAWNLFLAIFSTAGAIRVAPELFGVLFNKGFQATYCSSEGMLNGVNGYWIFVFMLSKLIEFVDTLFIVLRKRPLVFLHWYHHILTLMYGAYAYSPASAFNRWGIFLNFTVHSFMYGYYFLRSVKVKIPGSVAKMITTMQILQFVISIAILSIAGYQMIVNKVSCDIDMKCYYLASFMDFTYLVLFINFFLQSYVFRGGKQKYQAKKEEAKSD